MEVLLGSRKVFTVQVDEADLDLAEDYYWYLSDAGYTKRPRKQGTRKPLNEYNSLHQAIAARVFGIDSLVGMEVDHKNGNTLDNRRENLRVITPLQNKYNLRVDRANNTSGFKGVSRDRRSGKWKAYITVNYKYRHLGTFLTVEEAAIAYNKAALEHFGEFARLNCLDTDVVSTL